MCLYKGLAMQMKYLTFLSGCAKTDTARFAKLLTTNCGPLGSQGFDKAIAALKENVGSIKLQLKALKDSLETCSRDISGIRSELSKWRKEWKKLGVAPAPKIIYDPEKVNESMIPFIISITNADSSASEQQELVATIVDIIAKFYKPSQVRSVNRTRCTPRPLVHHTRTCVCINSHITGALAHACAHIRSHIYP